jgi:nucleoside-diphosphate-sugar epimerase
MSAGSRPRIAVTGAGGFVGGRVAAALAAGNRVYAFGRRPPAAFARRGIAGLAGLAGYRQWDLTTGRLADAPEVDAVVHCAGAVTDWGPDALFRAVNVAGTAAVLETFPRARLVHISTSSVYDPRRPMRRLREDAPYATRYLNGYAASKAAAERLVRARCPGAAILRPHAVYGPGDTTLLPRLLGARRLGVLPAVGDGTNLLSVAHVDNLVHAVRLALETPQASGPFNVADAAPAPLDELLRTLLRRLGLPPRIVYIPFRLAWTAGELLERGYRLARARHGPPLTRYLAVLLGAECTLDLRRAAGVLGYRPLVDHRTGPL